MSVHQAAKEKKVTIQTLLDRKRNHEKITSLTAYDFPMARLVDEAGTDFILVGDSLANVVLGYETTLEVTLDDVIFCTRAVRRAVKRALVVGDMPFGSYHTSVERALDSAVRLIKEGGAEAVKLEGGQKRAYLIEKIVDNEIPVMGHIGLTPQSINRMGGYKVQGKTLETANQLIEDALALEKAGVFAIVLEGVPGEIARAITERVKVPTIGIGAGVDCDGQILVISDVLGLNFGHQPRFVRQYVDLKSVIGKALETYVQDIRTGNFPGPAETYSLPDEVAAKLKKSNVGFL